MQKSTIRIIEYLQVDESLRDPNFPLGYLVDATLATGNKTDAEALLNLFLKNPLDEWNDSFRAVFAKFGDQNLAKPIFDTVILEGKLKEGFDVNFLELLGILKYEPIKPVLIDYVFTDPWNTYHDIVRSAVLGLLHFDCPELEEQITTEIKKVYGKSLFPEYIPALVCKLQDRKAILEDLYNLGENVCATGCTEGIVLGFSLCGREGKGYFKKALFNRSWEINTYSRATFKNAYKGLDNLGLTFEELWQEIRMFDDLLKIDYSLKVLFNLLDLRTNEILMIGQKNESFSGIYTALFEPGTGLTVYDLANLVDREKEAFRIESLLLLKMQEELIFDNLVYSLSP